jgi:superfamily II DNA/RNA helicase
LAFLTPLIERLLWNMDESPGLAVLVVAPGRELASQIVSVARSLLECTGLTVQLAIGGTTFSHNLEQIRKRKPNIVVGTPGRIAELVVGKPGEK